MPKQEPKYKGISIPIEDYQLYESIQKRELEQHNNLSMPKVIKKAMLLLAEHQNA